MIALLSVLLAPAALWAYWALPTLLSRRVRWGAYALCARAPAACEEYARGFAAWAAHHRFEWRGSLVTPGSLGYAVGVYSHLSNPVFLEIEMRGSHAIWRFRSCFQRDVMLTTTSEIDPIAPLRGERRQVFPDASLEELWAHHKRAHVHLVRSRRAVHPDQAPEYRETTLKALARERQETRANRLWWLKIPLGYLEAKKSLNEPIA